MPEKSDKPSGEANRRSSRPALSFQSAMGSKLREYYDSTLREPVPERLQRALDKLDKIGEETAHEPVAHEIRREEG